MNKATHGPGPANVRKRYAAERRFRFFGLAAILVTAVFLVILLLDILIKALPAFTAHSVSLDVPVDASLVDAAKPETGDFDKLVKDAWRAKFPEVTERTDRRQLVALLSNAASNDLRERVVADPGLIGKSVSTTALLADEADLYLKGLDNGQINEKQAGWLNSQKSAGTISQGFAWNYFLNSDSREAEQAGIRGALTGSLLVIVVTLAISLPLGVAAALYLEEFAPKSRFTDLIEVNINNLAAVPSIIFGLLGLAVFLNAFALPRSSAVVGGLVLSLLVLPTIIIASRAALRSVPPSIKEAALGVGASHQQAVFHHVLPLALPGILTGTILGVSRALGETAPLLMIGMIAFIADVPHGFTDAATVLPVQIFLWSDLPEAGFRSRTAATIILLLLVLFFFNALAIYLRKRFERRW
jgi:phosphate transport system permease protein